MKVLFNCSIAKLREYRQAYGTPETISASFIKEFHNEIWLLNECGEHVRTMRKGTKLLISFSGIEITERQFLGRTKKAIEKRTAKKIATIEENKIAQQERQTIAAQQAAKWIEFLEANPESKAKYILKCKTMPSSKWRNYLRMKAAKHINNECFSTLEISAPELAEILHK